jgi:hypothetical protein
MLAIHTMSMYKLFKDALRFSYAPFLRSIIHCEEGSHSYYHIIFIFLSRVSAQRRLTGYGDFMI